MYPVFVQTQIKNKTKTTKTTKRKNKSSEVDILIECEWPHFFYHANMNTKYFRICSSTGIPLNQLNYVNDRTDAGTLAGKYLIITGTLKFITQYCLYNFVLWEYTEYTIAVYFFLGTKKISCTNIIIGLSVIVV